MLQQTQVGTVIPYWERWLKSLPTIQSLAKARPDKVLKLWEGLGYYTRARNLQRAAQLIVDRHAGRFPRTFVEILALPGIGRYTAGAICSIAFNQPTPIVDGNVTRVLCRLYCIRATPKEKIVQARLWRLAEGLVQAAAVAPPDKTTGANCSHLNQSLMELGAVICTPRRPQCSRCPLRECCVAWRKGCADQLPVAGKRPPTMSRKFVAFVVERRGRFLVRQRPAGVVNAGLWEFPNVEGGGEIKSEGRNPKAERIPNTKGRSRKLGGVGDGELRALLTAATPGERMGRNAQFRRLCAFQHSVTRYRITLEAYLVSGGLPKAGDGGTSSAKWRSGSRWLRAGELRKLAFTGAHRKILAMVEAQGKAP